MSKKVHFTIEKKELLKRLKEINGTLKEKNSNKKIKAVIFELKNNSLIISRGNNLIYAKTKTKNVKTILKGKISIQYNILKDLLKTFPNVKLEFKFNPNINPNIIIIKYRHMKYNVPTLEYEIYSPEPELLNYSYFKIKENKLKRIIKRASLTTMTNDSSKPALKGIYLEINDNILNIVSTDVYRLQHFKYELKDFSIINNIFNCIIYTECIDFLKNILKSYNDDMIEIRFNNNHIQIIKKDFIFSSCLMTEDRYPSYKELIANKYHNTLILNSNELNNTLKRIKVIKKHLGNETVYFNIENKELSVFSQKHKGSIDKINIKKIEKNKKHKFALNLNFLLDYLKYSNEEQNIIKLIENKEGKIVQVIIIEKGLRYVIAPAPY